MRAVARALCALVWLAACDDSRETHSSDADLEQDAAAPDAEPPPEPGALINNALWRVVEWGEDPFSEGPSLPCPVESAGDESLGGEFVYAIRTERCPSLSVWQASRRAVLAGDTIRVRAYHFPLTAPENATAQLVLRLGEREIFRRALPIPSDASELEDTWTADDDYPVGTPILFHVQNHGANEYALIAIDVSR
jgi:hypothetical protein